MIIRYKVKGYPAIVNLRIRTSAAFFFIILTNQFNSHFISTNQMKYYERTVNIEARNKDIEEKYKVEVFKNL